MHTSSPTRWWSRWEVLHQVLKYFGHVEPLLRDNPDVSARLRDRMLVILEDQAAQKHLMVELAIVIDVGSPL